MMAQLVYVTCYIFGVKFFGETYLLAKLNRRPYPLSAGGPRTKCGIMGAKIPFIRSREEKDKSLVENELDFGFGSTTTTNI